MSLIRLAQRATQNSRLIARLVDVYMTAESKTWQQIAKELNITDEQLAKLSLCNRPRESKYLEDIKQIAGYVGADQLQLTRFLRQATATEAMQTSQLNQWLLAARDNDETDTPVEGDDM